MSETSTPQAAAVSRSAREAHRGGVAVLGVGNALMGDDGVGVAVIRALEKEALPARVELFDAGTALPDVLSETERCSRIVLIDSCRGGGAPGTIYKSRLRIEEWDGGPIGVSLHDLGALHALQMHRLSGGTIGEVVLIGVEPETITMREGLSPALEARLPEILATVRAECGLPADSRRGGAE